MSKSDIHTRGREVTRIRCAGDSDGHNPPSERRAAARMVATVAVDADECAELLDMLGLTAADGLQPLDD